MVHDQGKIDSLVCPVGEPKYRYNCPGKTSSRNYSQGQDGDKREEQRDQGSCPLADPIYQPANQTNAAPSIPSPGKEYPKSVNYRAVLGLVRNSAGLAERFAFIGDPPLHQQ
jgi:hypothetical protein